MKNQISKLTTKTFALFTLMMMSMVTYAQDGLDIDVDLGGNDTPSLFSNPVFWIGVAVFIIVLALIMRGKK